MATPEKKPRGRSPWEPTKGQQSKVDVVIERQADVAAAEKALAAAVRKRDTAVRNAVKAGAPMKALSGRVDGLSYTGVVRIVDPGKAKEFYEREKARKAADREAGRQQRLNLD